MTRVACGFVVSLGLATALSAQAPTGPSVQQLQAQVQQLDKALRAEREVTDALKNAAADKSQAIARMAEQMPSACALAFEKSNPGKTLDLSTFEVKDKMDPQKGLVKK